DVKAFDRDNKHFVTGNFDLAGERLQLVSLWVDQVDLLAALDEVVDIAGIDPVNVVVDVYVQLQDSDSDSSELEKLLEGVVDGKIKGTPLRRATFVAVADSRCSYKIRTYRKLEGRSDFVIDGTIDDMHPLTGQRLNLWRLKNFDGKRLPAAPGTYLFQLNAKNNPADERLMALAEIRGV
ncbi:hypothetical protein, partial [Rhodococcoides yunnanense]|uniref:hypothetical protein n=1 Tax=Rhodococcoides yunnanense TaxID=278209 RepID=UPI0022B1FF1C